MRRTWGALIVAVWVAGPWAGVARADTTAHVIGSATVGYNDNILGTPSSPQPGEATPVNSWFLEVAPGVTVFHESRRAMHQLTYTHPIVAYFARSSLGSSSDVGSWRGLFLLSPRDELTLGASATHTKINSGALRETVGQTTAGVTPEGGGRAVTMSASQGYTHDFTEQWHGLQSASFSAATRIGDDTTEPNHYLVETGLGAEYTVGRDGFGLLGRGGWFFTPPEREQGVVVASRQDQLVFGSDFRWRHDWGPRWTTRATVGAAASVDPNDFHHVLWAPTWSGGILFADEGPAASLVYTRTVAPNVLVGQNYLSDQLTLSGGLPLSRRVPVLFGSSVGAAQSRAIDAVTQTLTGRVRSWVADASLSWMSEAGFGAALRYQHYRQYGDDAELEPVPTFHRNVVQLTVGGMYPARELPQVPGGPPMRVDGRDRTIGAGVESNRPRPRAGN